MTPAVWACLLAMSVGWAARPRPPIRRPDALPDVLPEVAPDVLPDVAGDPAHATSSGRRHERSASVDGTWRPSLGRRPHRDRRPRRSDDAVELARWCEALARAVRGGDALRSALERVEPPSADIARRAGVGRGAAPSGPLGDGGPDVAIVVAVVTACLEHGGPAAEPLDRAAGVLRSRAAERAERRVQSAQARLSATVLTWLPVAVLGVMVATSPAVRRVVVSPLGATIVTAGAIVNLIGWWWMRRIVERAAR
jgi:hypothetical protein